MKNVLLLEENKPLATFIQTEFEKQGYNLDPVHHSSEVIKALGKNDYELFISAAVLSFKGGSRFIKSLPRDPLFSLPVILLTSADLSFHKKDGWQVHEVLRKPFHINKLLNTAENLLQN